MPSLWPANGSQSRAVHSVVHRAVGLAAKPYDHQDMVRALADARQERTLGYKMTQSSTWEEPMRRIITCLVVALVPLLAANAQPLKPNTPSILQWTPEQQREGYRSIETIYK